MWCIAVEEKKTGKFRLFEEGESIAHDDPEYGDVHILPFVEKDGFYYFGVHEFKRDCFCRPTLKLEEGKRMMVIHEERKAN